MDTNIPEAGRLLTVDAIEVLYERAVLMFSSELPERGLPDGAVGGGGAD